MRVVEGPACPCAQGKARLAIEARWLQLPFRFESLRWKPRALAPADRWRRNSRACAERWIGWPRPSRDSPTSSHAPRTSAADFTVGTARQLGELLAGPRNSEGEPAGEVRPVGPAPQGSQREAPATPREGQRTLTSTLRHQADMPRRRRGPTRGSRRTRCGPRGPMPGRLSPGRL